MNRQYQIINYSSASMSRDNEIMLWYFRMGYGNFHYRKQLLHSIISNKNLYDLQCEIYELTKHHRMSFETQLQTIRTIYYHS